MDSTSVPAFCRREKSLSCSRKKGWLVGASYKRRCQEKYLPFGSEPGGFFSASSLYLLERARSIGECFTVGGAPHDYSFVSLHCAKRRDYLPSLWFHFTIVTAPIAS